MVLPHARKLMITTLGPCSVPSPLPARGVCWVDEARCLPSFADTMTLQPFLQTGACPPTRRARHLGWNSA